MDRLSLLDGLYHHLAAFKTRRERQGRGNLAGNQSQSPNRCNAAETPWSSLEGATQSATSLTSG